LRVSVEPELPGKQITNAKSIQFHTDDLETADEIQGALNVPQQQISALIAKVSAQEKELAAHKEAYEQQIAALKTDIDTRFTATVAMSSFKAIPTNEAEGNANDRRVTVRIAINKGIANTK